METKEKLNSLLRLRLFFSTEDELSDYIGYKLKGNHFNRFKPFQSEAYFSQFAKECEEMTQKCLDLSTLLMQYEATSNFYKHKIQDTNKEGDMECMEFLMEYLYLGAPKEGNESDRTKYLKLCKDYEKCNQEGELNIAILALISFKLIPTFWDKSWQDVKDIVGDFKRVYEWLQELAQKRRMLGSTNFKEMICVKELRVIIEEEEKKKEKQDEEQQNECWLNRLQLIFITNDILERIFALEEPTLLRKFAERMVPMNMRFETLYHCTSDAENVVWQYVGEQNGWHVLFRNEIDRERKQIRYSMYQLFFNQMGFEDFCYTYILRPAFQYLNLCKKEIPEEVQGYSYAGVELEKKTKKVKEVTFVDDSPMGKASMTLEVVTKEEELKYYNACLEHKGIYAAYDEVDVDAEEGYHVDWDEVEVAVSNEALFFKLDQAIYRIDKRNQQGAETIAGIESLTHTDNCLYAELVDGGQTRRFLCLDPINQNLDLDWLFEQPFCRKIGSTAEVL